MESKICSKCGESKELSKFPKFLQRDGVTIGRRNTCNACYYKRRNKKDAINESENTKEMTSEEATQMEWFENDCENFIEFTEDEIARLKVFIDNFDKIKERKEVKKKRSTKESVTLELDVDIFAAVERCSMDTSINVSDIVNAILIREFIHNKTS